LSPFPPFLPILQDPHEEAGYRFLLGSRAGAAEGPGMSGGELKYLRTFVAAHEAAELALLLHTGWQDPFSRWFADGWANHVGLKAIEALHGEAARAAAPYGSEDRGTYEHRRGAVNLLAWPAGHWERRWPELAPSGDLAPAHYAFATEEVERFAVLHGEDALRRVIELMRLSEEKHQRRLERFFAKVSGSDAFWSRLREYSIACARRKSRKIYGARAALALLRLRPDRAPLGPGQRGVAGARGRWRQRHA
jgi:hypothetical protein